MTQCDGIEGFMEIETSGQPLLPRQSPPVPRDGRANRAEENSRAFVDGIDCGCESFVIQDGQVRCER